jgi:hypothetical protein
MVQMWKIRWNVEKPDNGGKAAGNEGNQAIPA